jgi:HAE1 family hydrophobic/amphiphilic exporter-1
MISRFFIERPIFANVIAIVTIILGLVCFYILPVAQYPEIVPPTIQVSTRYPGASAQVISETVGIPIEQAVNGVENSLYMSSTSGSDGTYTLTITFAVGTDLNTSLSLVQNLVNGALASLPETVQAQGVTVKKVSPEILQVVSLYADDDRFDETFLTNYAIINLQYPLARLPGVGQIRVVGAGPYSMRVWLNPNKLQDYGLTTLDVVNAIKQQNIQVVAGQIGTPPVPGDQVFQFTINALGRLSDVEQFDNIIVKSARSETAKIVRVRDIARVELSQQYFSNFAGLSGHKTSQVFIHQAIDAVYETLYETGILVLLVIMVFLQNWRATLVPATTVPVTIIGAFAAMALLGFSVNLMTLFALILAIGIVVDDAIVIVENFTAVFLPAAFLPGITGQLFRQFALVIASTAIISAINALTLKPAQCALYLRPRQEKRVNLFYRGFNKVYQALEDSYTGLVRWMVHRPGPMVGVFAAIIALTGWGFALHPTGFLPTEDQGYAIVVGQLPDAAAQPRVKRVSEEVDAILKKAPGIKAWVKIGGFSVLDGANLPTSFSTFVIFEDWKKRGSALSQEKIVARLQREFGAIQEGELAVLIPPPISGLGQSGGFQMMVEDRASHGLTQLQKAVWEIIHTGNAQAGLRGLISTFSARSPQLYLDIDRVKAESLGIPLNSVFDTLQAYLGSSFVNLFNKFNQVFQVYVQADAPYRLEPEDIKNLFVRNARGDMVPLGTLLSVERMVGPELVTRYNLYPAAAIYGAAAPGFSSGQALSLMEQMARHTLPQGMAYDWTATAYQEKQVGSQAYFIYLLSITLVFLVLAAQYESWFSPAAVILVVPLALVGVLLALIIRGFDTNLYTQVGLVLMIALASKNAILIVEFARELRADGLSIADAAVEATRRRFRPIVMTSFAFIMGVVPLLKASGAGAASQQAIGTVVFGGMLSSTLLAIPFVSVFYVVTQRLGEWRRHKAALPASPQLTPGHREPEIKE